MRLISCKAYLVDIQSEYLFCIIPLPFERALQSYQFINRRTIVDGMR